MAIQDGSAPATLGDLSQLETSLKSEIAELRSMMETMMSTIMTAFGDLESRMATKDDLLASENRMLTLIEAQKHDVVGMLKDVRSNDRQVQDHEERIQRIEGQLAMAA